MTATATKTAGQELADELRRYFRVGTRTRRYRTVRGHRTDLHADMIEAINLACTMPGYYTERTEKPLRVAGGVYLSWLKHVGGYRIDGMLRLRLTQMSPWQLADLLGRMVDAGITNVGEGEQFFREMAKEIRA